MCRELLQNNVDLVMRFWAGHVIVPPLVIRCDHYLLDNNLRFVNAIPSTITSPLAPWIDIGEMFVTDFNIPVDYLSCERTAQLFKHFISSRYPDLMQVFADGSRIHDPIMSTSAAMVIPIIDHVSSWRISLSSYLNTWG